MPHISHFAPFGTRLPSVNEVTDALSKDGLIRAFFNRKGAKVSEEISEKARTQGIEMADAFEHYRKSGVMPDCRDYIKSCLQNWTAWFEASPYYILDDKFVEIHLVNTVEGYHGSPDLVLHNAETQTPELWDDKSKVRFADYKLHMNEVAYAWCDSYEVDGEIIKLPWEPPMPFYTFGTYHPATAKLYTHKYPVTQDIFDDFLLCKKMGELNKRTNDFFKLKATRLPKE